ncbi:MAG: hypothetical protein IJC83_06760, partial [Oscillospiraceae bacterium]|nr:hypothetical protein [Oscillospiraceae bacterium]
MVNKKQTIFLTLGVMLVVLMISVFAPFLKDKLSFLDKYVGVNSNLEQEDNTSATGDTITDGNFIFTELADGTYSVKRSSTSISGDIVIP